MILKTSRSESASRILIYRLGSIGDTVVALPAFRFVAEMFPGTERRVLTNMSTGLKAAPLDVVLEPMNLVHGYFTYPLETRDPRALYRLAIEIRRWSPQLLVYLAQPRGRFKILRDTMFFKLCGLQKLVGIPWSQDLQQCRKLDHADLWESEASRLLRCLGFPGKETVNRVSSPDLNLTEAEQRRAHQVLEEWPARTTFICAGIGTKSWVNDWGIDNWISLSNTWSAKHTGVGLVIVGSSDEYEISQKVAEAWSGSARNLCGQLTPRETAALIRAAVLFVGHDSGIMHLAASVGRPCVAIFSARNLPGEWYPAGDHHRIIYHREPCFGCRLAESCDYDKKCIRSIAIEEVGSAMEEVWNREIRNGSIPE